MGLSPNYIFPIIPPQDFQVQNLGYFTYQMFRPLYWYGVGSTTNLNTSLSLAYPPVYNSTSTQVTIRLKNVLWSDGTPVTARDIEFWENLIVAGKSNWAGYNVGAYPDNIVKTTIVNPTTITFTFDKSYSPAWFTYNELSQITPLPQHVMDVTSPTSPVGNYDLTPEGATAVYNYLTAQGQILNTFATNPLWKTVDGPWQLKSLSQTGLTVFVPNERYAGPSKPSVSQLVEEPFASPAAVTNALLSGSVNYTDITTDQIPLVSRFKAAGYNTVYASLYGIQGLVPNENNPVYGPLFKQVYFRQSLERLVDQPTIITRLESGNGVSSCGPVPLLPPSKYVSPLEKRCPLSYSPAGVTRVLRAHGWHVNPGGVSVCTRGGAGGCGNGVPAGMQAQFHMIYPQGEGLDQMMLLIKSDAAKVGIQLTIQSVPIVTDFLTVLPCKATASSCSWQIGYYVWVYQPDYLPTGDTLFTTGAGSNVGNYSDPVADSLITTTFHSASLKDFYAYEDYVAMAVPWVWLPFGKAPYEVTSNLSGPSPVNTFLFVDPASWRYHH